MKNLCAFLIDAETMSEKLINKIIADTKKGIFNSSDSIKEKLDYYRQLSKNGLSNLSDVQFEELYKDVNVFFNFHFHAFVDMYPTKLYRISFNKEITQGDGRGGRLTKLSQLLGPPKDKSKLNRCNLFGESIFYSSIDINTAVLETKPEYMRVITLSEWKLKEGEKLMVNGIFNHPDVLQKSKNAKDAYDGYLKFLDQKFPNQVELIDSVIRFITEEFIKQVPKDKPREYLFSATLSSLSLRIHPIDVPLDGIFYPSVQRKYSKSNFAIINSLVLNKLDLEAITTFDVMNTHYDIDATTDEGILQVFKAYRRITEFDFNNDRIIY